MPAIVPDPGGRVCDTGGTLATPRADPLTAAIRTWTRVRRPDAAFAGSTRRDWVRWRARFLPRYARVLGPWPAPARTPNVRVTERVRRPGYVRSRLEFESTPGLRVPCYRLEPEGLGKAERRPGLLAAHGHGRGKADVCGVTAERGTPAERREVAELHYAYAVDAVRHGYVVLAPDWIPFGERRPPDWFVREGRDACDIASHALASFGTTLIAQNVWDGMRAVDLLAAHPNVDPRRLGVIGLSYGGTMAAHLLANDPRLKAGVVSGYVSTLRGDAFTRRGAGNTCGAQVLPGILRHGDLPEVFGLIAPKPLLCEMGRRETCFHYPDMARAYARVARIYRAAGAADRLAADVFAADHRWSGRRAWEFLARWL